MTKHIRVPQPENPVTLCVQPSLAQLIMPSFPIVGVLASVKLDDETVFVAHEVNDERSHWSLTAKAQSVKAMGAPLGPKRVFGVGHF
jgi:hypothetical protein